MRFSLTDDQVAFRDAVGGLLARECPPERVRSAWADGTTAVADLWPKLAEMDLPGALVPEAAGGLGLDVRDVVPVLEEAGRVALPLPIVEVMMVAAPLLAALEPGDARLAGLIDGDLLVGCDLTGSGLVPHCGVAHAYLLADGDSLIWVDAGQVSLERLSSIDSARDLARVLPTGGERLSSEPDLIDDARDRGALGTAALLVGLSRRLLEMATEYVKQREQFGVLIGSFQAVKHHLANALVAIESAAPAVSRAGHSIATADPERRRDVSMAKALASEAAEKVARLTLQCHGAIGYTVEYDLHLYAKRIWALTRSWGDADWHRSRVAHALGLRS